MSIFSDVLDFFESNPIIGGIVDAAKAVEVELKQLISSDLTKGVEAIAQAILDSLAGGGSTANAIAAGITEAEAQFNADKKQLSQQAITTLATHVLNSVQAQPSTSQ